MKILLSLLFITSVISAQKLKVVKIKPLDNYKFDTTLELHNESNQKIRYVSMYCSYSGFYTTDSPDVKVITKPCDKNFPITATVGANSYQNVNLELEMAKGTKKSKFRIGLKFIEIPKNMTLADSASIKSVTIWSNPIELKSR